MGRQRTIIQLLCIALTAGVSNPASAQDKFNAAAFVEAYSVEWNTHDAARVAALFGEDADMVIGALPRAEGRSAIEAWWRAYFDNIDANRKGAFVIHSSRALTHDVYLINVDTLTSGEDASGAAMPERRARGTWVVVAEDDGWRIAAMCGLPAAGEQRFKPGVDK